MELLLRGVKTLSVLHQRLSAFFFFLRGWNFSGVKSLVNADLDLWILLFSGMWHHLFW